MKHKIFTIIKIGVIIAYVGLATTSCRENRTEQESIRPIAVRVAKPRFTDLQSRLSYMGTVHPNHEVKVIAQVQGTVVSLPKPEGTPISKGDLIVEIDVPDIHATVERLQADLDYWRHRYASDQRLVEVKALPSEQMEASFRAYRSAKAALAEAKAKYAKAKEFSSIKGQVLSWLVEPGQHVMPGQPILLLGSDAPELHVEVVEEDLQRGIQVGVPVNVQDWQGHKFQSFVSEIASVATGPARTFTVKLPVPAMANQVEDLRVGTSMQVQFILESRQNSIAVPVEAIFLQNDTPTIFLIQENRTTNQPVTTGIEQDGQIEVVFPWNGKDYVAVSNLRSLEDNALVFPVKVKEVTP